MSYFTYGKSENSLPPLLPILMFTGRIRNSCDNVPWYLAKRKHFLLCHNYLDHKGLKLQTFTQEQRAMTNMKANHILYMTYLSQHSWNIFIVLIHYILSSCNLSIESIIRRILVLRMANHFTSLAIIYSKLLDLLFFQWA